MASVCLRRSDDAARRGSTPPTGQPQRRSRHDRGSSRKAPYLTLRTARSRQAANEPDESPDTRIRLDPLTSHHARAGWRRPLRIRRRATVRESPGRSSARADPPATLRDGQARPRSRVSRRRHKPPNPELQDLERDDRLAQEHRSRHSGVRQAVSRPTRQPAEVHSDASILWNGFCELRGGNGGSGQDVLPPRHPALSG